MLLLIKENYVQIGYTILVISVITGIYGVVLAIVQHNVKKLLAYHSIENIGIIGIGIGIGTIGLGLNNYYLSFAGFAGALLHTLNHSLFKSLLFYGAGTIYQATHIMDIEKLGGLVKKMPQTAVLFLIAALAICGLPPFNGFISEFLIYSGLFGSFSSANMSLTLMLLFTIFGLVLIGGLALLCFTKAFGIIFLGTERHPHQHLINDPGLTMLFPKYLIAAAILIIGVVPQLFIGVLSNPVGLLIGELTPPLNAGQSSQGFIDMMQKISFAVWGLIGLSIVVYFIRRILTATRSVATEPTWGCGYTAPSPKLQYTANSFVRSYRKLIGPILMMNKKESEVSGVFPAPVHSSTHPFDKLEAFLIITPIKHLKGFMGKFGFLQNGNPQFYILYGAVFILSIIIIPMFMEAIFYLIELFSQI
jgi:formate hydrogenlyase subunit 3/multisubunit Na+/H+ antiporter MnhD subunit